MLRLPAFVLKTKKELLGKVTNYPPYSAYCYIPWLNRTINSTGISYKATLSRLQALVHNTLENAEEASSQDIDIVLASDTPSTPPSPEAGCKTEEPLFSRINACLLALKPLADIADAYDDNGLDEVRPDWAERGVDNSDFDKELYCGRGGKTLITLRDALHARNVLRDTAAGRVLPVIFQRQKMALKEIHSILDRKQTAQRQVSSIRALLEKLES